MRRSLLLTAALALGCRVLCFFSSFLALAPIPALPFSAPAWGKCLAAVAWIFKLATG